METVGGELGEDLCGVSGLVGAGGGAGTGLGSDAGRPSSSRQAPVLGKQR